MEHDKSTPITEPIVIDFTQLPKNEEVFSDFSMKYAVRSADFQPEDLAVIAAMAAEDCNVLSREYHNFFLSHGDHPNPADIIEALKQNIERNQQIAQTKGQYGDDARKLLVFDYGLLHLVERHEPRTVGAISRILEDWQKF